MQQTAEGAITDYFGNQGARFEEEQRIIGGIICQLVSAHGYVTNKAVILCLIEMLETSESVVEQDVLRSALEIVLGRMADDSGL
jgi:hypothetical protein